MPTLATPVLKCLAAAVRTQVPVMTWGHPGSGKTAELTAMMSKWNFHLETIIASLRDASDFLGWPIDRDGTLTFDPPDWAKRLHEHQGVSALYLDEFSTISTMTQKGMLRVVNELDVGGLPIPRTSIIASANPPSSAVDGDDLPAAMANRFLHLEWASDLDRWFEGMFGGFDDLPVPGIDDLLTGGTAADEARAKGQVVGFIKATGTAHIDCAPPSDPSVAGRGWPSRRSWTNLVRMLGQFSSDDPAALMAATGLVGEASAKEFTAWRAAHDLYDPAEVIAGTVRVSWMTDRPDKLFALVGAIVSLGVHDTDLWLPAMAVLAQCSKAGRPDIVTPAARRLIRSMPVGVKLPRAVHAEFIEAFQSIMTSEGRRKFAGTWAS